MDDHRLPEPLRDRIAALRDCAVRIAATWRDAPGVAPELRAMWSSDALLAFEVLHHLHQDPPTVDDVARLQGTVACVTSELRGRPEQAALLDAWTRLADPLLADLRSHLDASPDPATRLSHAHPHLVRQLPVVRTGDRRYELFCAVCGKRAVTIAIEPDAFATERGRLALVCEGIVWRLTMSLEHAEPLFAHLERGDVGAAHQLLIDRDANPEGIDAWCPPCGRIYCKQHYGCVDAYDEGFYDMTMGTCPHGHTRRIAD